MPKAATPRTPKRHQQPEPIPILPPKPKIPDWASGMKPDTSYNLTMYESSGFSTEDIHITRAEYISLKMRLAELRGIPHQLVHEEEIPEEIRYSQHQAV